MTEGALSSSEFFAEAPVPTTLDLSNVWPSELHAIAAEAAPARVATAPSVEAGRILPPGDGTDPAPVPAPGAPPPLVASPSGRTTPCMRKSPRLARRAGVPVLAAAMERKAALRAGVNKPGLDAAGKCSGNAPG